MVELRMLGTLKLMIDPGRVEDWYWELCEQTHNEENCLIPCTTNTIKMFSCGAHSSYLLIKTLTERRDTLSRMARTIPLKGQFNILIFPRQKWNRSLG